MDDLTRAWRVVTLGCNLGEMSNEVSHKQEESWDDIPPPRQDLATAKNVILNHVERFLLQLDKSY